MGKLNITTKALGNALNVQMSGIIDEDADFSQHPLSSFQNIEFNLEGVKSINSCGIREWIKWIETSSGSQITFEKCPKVIIDQMNMVDGFLPKNGKVLSFFVPYYNESSGAEKNILFNSGVEFVGAQLNPPSDIKDDDGNEMEMDVIETKYFKFLKL